MTASRNGDASSGVQSAASVLPPPSSTLMTSAQQHQQHQITQLCFNRNQFTRSDFNVDIFLTSVRRRATIEQIQQDLRAYLKIVQNSMIELINDDFADFVNLSSTLVNLRSTLDKVSDDYDQISGDFKESTSELLNASEELMLVRRKLQENNVHQQQISLKLKIFTLLEKQKSVLNRSLSAEATEPKSDQMSVIRRITNMFQLQRALLSENERAQSSPVDNADLTAAVRQLSNCFIRLLDRNLIQLVGDNDLSNSPSSKAVYTFAQLCDGYAACDRLDAAVNTLVIHWAQPQLEAHLTKVDKKDKSVWFSAVLDWLLARKAALQTVFAPAAVQRDALLSQKVQNQPIALHCSCPISAGYVEHYEVLSARSVSQCESTCLQCLLSLLLACMDDQSFKPVLIATDADSFRACLGLFKEFSSSWLAANRSGDAANQAAILKMCFDKFNASVYSRLRVSECKARVSQALQRHGQQALAQQLAAGNTHNEVLLDATRCVLDALQWLWSDQVFIGCISDRLWSHSLQLLADYTGWLQQAVANVITPAAPPPAAAAAPVDSAHAAGATPAAAEPSQPAAASEGQKEKTQVALALLADAQSMEQRAIEVAFDSIYPRLRSLGIEETSKFGRILSSVCAQLQTTAAPASAFVEKLLNDKLSACLNGANEVPRAYRWTRKEPPTKPSAYVTQAETVWTELQELSASDRSLLRPIIEHTCEHAVQVYSTHVNNVLVTANKMSSSLSRLKMGSSAALKSDAAAEQTQLSDDQKIRLQLRLDVVAFESVVESLLQSEESQECLLLIKHKLEPLKSMTEGQETE